jgi:hypothetical protein
MVPSIPFTSSRSDAGPDQFGPAITVHSTAIHPPHQHIQRFKFTVIDAVAAKIKVGKDVRIILSQFQVPKGGLEALQAAGVNLDNVKI